jgi:NACHT domain
VNTGAEPSERLAEAVRAQWVYELAALGISTPFPLMVSWSPADPPLAEPWEALVAWVQNPSLGRSRPGPGFTLLTMKGRWRPPPPRMWAAGLAGLAGSGDELPDVLRRVPTGRLVVLGEPGAGKTVLMIRLVLQLLERRQAGDQVPVLFSLASWNPVASHFTDWLAGQLARDHPFLAARATGRRHSFRRQPSSLANDLLWSGEILPVVDGLDELPEAARANALRSMTWDLVRPLVVTCRTGEWAAIVARSRFPGAAVVQLQPLAAGTVAGYLRDSVPGEGQVNRWDAVTARLDAPGPLGQALSTPLMAGLARDIYGRRGGPDPAELLELASKESVELRLLDGFTPAAFARRWVLAQPSAVRAERWLTYLAAYLDAHHTRDLAWWELQRAVPAFVAQLAGGFVAGLGVQAEDDVRPRTIQVRGLAGSIHRMPPRQLAIAAALGLGAGVIGQITGGLAGMAGGITAGLVTGLAFGLPRIIGRPADPAADPASSIRRDRLVALTAGLAGTALGGLLGIAATTLMRQTALGFTGGAVLGLVTGVAGTAWGRFQAARAWLALTGRLPWRLVGFLSYAHAVGVLRQNGSVYQFRHALLQDHLARQAPALDHRDLRLGILPRLGQCPAMRAMQADRRDHRQVLLTVPIPCVSQVAVWALAFGPVDRLCDRRVTASSGSSSARNGRMAKRL